MSIESAPLRIDDGGPTDREGALAELGRELRRYQCSLDGFDETVSQRLGINRTDLRCLDLLEQGGSMTAGALAEASGLSSGAMTFVLDRLEGAGFAHRRRDDTDRRRVVVELDLHGAKRARALHEPLIRDARAAAGQFSVDELVSISRFMRTCRELYEEHAGLLRAEQDLPDP